MLTKQEIFDIVAVHLIKQGERAMNENGRCLYRSPDGKRCAAGKLMPDHLYKPFFENTTFQDLPFLVRRACYQGIAEDFDTETFIQELQQTHDLPQNWPDIKNVLVSFAEMNHLSTEAIDNL